MTNIGHFRAASEVLKQLEKGLPTKLWIAPPTKMDEHQLTEEGIYNIFGVAGARTEMPGCSLCMGNQARVAPNSTVVSTSTRNFPNRLGQGADVFLASSELAAVSAALGKIPTMKEYMTFMTKLDTMSGDIYQYLNFNQIRSYVNDSKRSDQIALTQVQELV
jgi:aconitate hydratase 2/2-methylisocitrate dehydratase